MQVNVQIWSPYPVPNYSTLSNSSSDPNADLYAAIPWAREAGLELIQLTNAMKYGTWMFVTRSHWFCADPKCKHDWFKLPTGGPAGMYGYYPTRAAALASPPPYPPGFVPKAEAKPPTLLERCAEAAAVTFVAYVIAAHYTLTW